MLHLHAFLFFSCTLHQLDNLDTEEGVSKPHPDLQAAASFDELRKRPLHLQTQAVA